jgi:hypothetical protein
MLSCRGLCDVLIAHQFAVCLTVYDLETSRMMRPRPYLGCCVTRLLQDYSGNLKGNDSSGDRDVNEKTILK